MKFRRRQPRDTRMTTDAKGRKRLMCTCGANEWQGAGVPDGFRVRRHKCRR